MIFYFSATGNSQWVAQYLSKAFNEPTCSVTDLLHVQAPDEISYLIQNQSEMLFFVFPVHSWGPAIVMRCFIRQLQLSGWRENRVFAVCTCGDDCGYTDRIVRKDLAPSFRSKCPITISLCVVSALIPNQCRKKNWH